MSLFERFRAGSVRNVNVWASHQNFGRVLAEPTQFKRNVQYPDGDMHTQAGWHVTLVFNNLAELATQLERGVEVPASFYPSDVGRRGAPPIRPDSEDLRELPADPRANRRLYQAHVDHLDNGVTSRAGRARHRTA